MTSAWAKAIIESALAGDERAGKVLRHLIAEDGSGMVDKLDELVAEKIEAQYQEGESAA